MRDPVGGPRNLDTDSTTVLPSRKGEAGQTGGHSSHRRHTEARPGSSRHGNDHDGSEERAPARRCSCGGILNLVPGPRGPRRGSRPVDEFLYHCRACKKQVTLFSRQSQTRRCLGAILFGLLVCVLGLLLFTELRKQSSIYAIGATAAALGLCVLTCRFSLRAFLRAMRNERRYPPAEPNSQAGG